MKLNEHPVGANGGTNGGTSGGTDAGARLRRIGLISGHALPLAAPGSIDCGGQNVYVAKLARELALAGYFVDIFTRRDAPTQRHPAYPFANLPNSPSLAGVRVIHVPAGPAHHVPKEQILRQAAPDDIVHANFFMSGMVAEHLKDALDEQKRSAAPVSMRGKTVFITAAASGLGAALDELSEEEWLRVIDTNLNGALLLTRQAAALTRRCGAGHIVNLASTGAKRARPYPLGARDAAGYRHCRADRAVDARNLLALT